MAMRRKPGSGQGDMVGDALAGMVTMGKGAIDGFSSGKKPLASPEADALAHDRTAAGPGFADWYKQQTASPMSEMLKACGGKLRKCRKFDGGGATGASGNPYGMIGTGIDAAATLGAKSIGNTMGDRNDPWTDAVRTTAYGDNTDNPLFAKSTRGATNALSDDLTNKSLFNAQSNTAAGLANDINEKAAYSANVKDASAGRKAAGLNNNVLRGAGWGAKVGSTFGPMGMAVGAIAGAAGGLGRGIGNLIAGKRRLKKLNNAIDARNQYTGASVNNAVNNLGKKTNNQAMAGFAYRNGGRIYAEGGEISNAKNQFRTGVTEFKTGGTHEENPHGGILQGFAEDGMPNLVEQGEVKLSSITGKDNNYILSNRLVIEQEVADEFGIDRKYVGMTFANAFKKAYEPFKERPNDPISRKEVASLSNKFEAAQEAVKAEQESEQEEYAQENPSPEALESMGEQARQMGYDAMTGQQQGAEGQETPDMQQQPMDAGAQQPMSPYDAMAMVNGQSAEPEQTAFAALGGLMRKSRKYAKGGHLLKNGGNEIPEVTVAAKRRDNMKPFNRFPVSDALSGLDLRVAPDKLNAYYQQKALRDTISKNGDERKAISPMTDLIDRDDVDERNEPSVSNGNQTPSQSANNGNDDNVERARKIADSMGLKSAVNESALRYAPVAASLYGLVDKDRYIKPEKYTAYDYEAMRKLHDDPRLVNAYQRSKLINPDVVANKIRSAGANASANAARFSGGNASLAAAGALSANGSTASQLGDAFLKAREYNNTMRQADANFNLGVKQNNAQTVNNVNATNDRTRTDRLNNIQETTASADTANIGTRINAMNSAGNKLGEFGREARDRADMISLASQGYLPGYLTPTQVLDTLNGKRKPVTSSLNNNALINN